MHNAFKVLWRENRGEGQWSGTLYSGLRIDLDGKPVVITKLSHGLRVVQVLDETKYHWEGVSIPCQVSDALIKDARIFLSWDQRFQQHMTEYSRLMP